MTLEDANGLILGNALFSGSMRKDLEMKGMKLNPVMVLSKKRSALEIGKHGNKGLHTTTLAFIRSCTVLSMVIFHHILYHFKKETHLSEEILRSCCGRSRQT